MSQGWGGDGEAAGLDFAGYGRWREPASQQVTHYSRHMYVPSPHSLQGRAPWRSSDHCHLTLLSLRGVTCPLRSSLRPCPQRGGCQAGAGQTGTEARYCGEESISPLWKVGHLWATQTCHAC